MDTYDMYPIVKDVLMNMLLQLYYYLRLARNTTYRQLLYLACIKA